MHPFQGAGSEQAVGRDPINVPNAEEVFLEDAGNINLECHQNHRQFLISRIAFLLRLYRVGN
jgi:hypothetical protein